MAEYLPPTDNLPIFDSSVFTDTGNGYLTYDQAKKNFLKYPNAQGTENFTKLNATTISSLSGNLTVNPAGNLILSPVGTSTLTNASLIQSVNNNNITVEGIGTGGVVLKSNGNDVATLSTTIVVSPPSTTKNLTMSANANIVMTSGTGIINQAIPSVTSEGNILKKTFININSGSAGGAGVSALEIVDNTAGADARGLFVIPNSGSGSLNALAQAGDTVFGGRNFPGPIAPPNQGGNSNAMVMTCWSNDKVGLRISARTIGAPTTELCAGNNNSITQSTTQTTFNNVVNFNPSAIASTRRQLIGVGTLSFTDIINGGTTGSIASTIYTDTTLVNTINGMYYNCGINGGYHQFSVKNGAGVQSTPIYYGHDLCSISTTLIIRNATTTSNRLDISTDNSQVTSIQAKSATNSTNATINITCATVNSGGGVTNNSVLNITPSYVEYIRPIKFTYSSQPTDITQLGYNENYNITATTVGTSAVVRNFGNFVIDSSGTFIIEVIIGLLGVTATSLTTGAFGCSNNNSSLPTITTPSFYTPSLIGGNSIALSTTSPSLLKINFVADFTSATNTIYVNYLVSMASGTVNISGLVKSTRIG